MSNKEPNVSGLIAHSQKKAQATRQRVSDAIDRLYQSNEAVNFNSVANEARVAKSYLYEQTELRERIDAIRLLQSQTKHRLLVNARKQRRTDASKDVLLAAKERRIRELESEVKKLKRELKLLHGKLYDRI